MKSVAKINEELINKGKKYVMNTYNYFPLIVEKGEGCYVWDVEGNKYLDFVSGIAVNALGYKNQEYIDNLTNQLNQISHCSNLYWNKPQIELAETLVENSCFDRVFFCNSGAEAIEASLKLARKYGKTQKGENCFEIITMKQSFHGRTLGAITATGQEKYQKDFTPLLPGIVYAEYNNFESVKEKVSENTCAILVEPIQGEGGIKPANPEFLKDLRSLCTEKNILLIFDEVQCGIGRTGKLFAYEHYGVEPDIIALAKGLGNGQPIGAMMAKENAAQAFQPGDHASTFGGNPVSCTAGLTVIKQLLNNGILQNAQSQGEYLKNKLIQLKKDLNIVSDVRGMGLMQGIELSVTVSEIIKKCMDKGLLLVGAGANVIRFVPPLIIKKKEIDQAMQILSSVLQETINEG